MNKSIIPVTPGLLALLSRVETGIKPFVHEIFLLEIVVAGTTHCSEIDQVEEFIVPEKVLTMKRDPLNTYDEFAIAIYCDTIRIGCTFRNEFGLLTFDGCRQNVFAEVVSKERKNKWLKIKANIYMVE